ncbi:hypothetical protein BPAE_0012g00220 [Botrytis paeoniae]|uniref:Uncharacterized protein n=1 Tax=Botrytis paeoniae TaxID=278948 RepID=A0A4Z1G147_9HELO|nr:hypothetical protein BPAE_0012g00220 [Botrytis paeoniae]
MSYEPPIFKKHPLLNAFTSPATPCLPYNKFRRYQAQMIRHQDEHLYEVQQGSVILAVYFLSNPSTLSSVGANVRNLKKVSLGLYRSNDSDIFSFEMKEYTMWLSRLRQLNPTFKSQGQASQHSSHGIILYSSITLKSTSISPWLVGQGFLSACNQSLSGA